MCYCCNKNKFATEFNVILMNTMLQLWSKKRVFGVKINVTCRLVLIQSQIKLFSPKLLAEDFLCNINEHSIFFYALIFINISTISF